VTNPAEVFQQRAADHDERAKYEPEGDRPEVVAPDLELFRETTASTDRALADGFFRYYRHLFCNGDGNLYVYHATRGRWSRDDVERQVLAYCMHLSDRVYDELATVTQQLRDARENGNGDPDALARRQAAINKLIIHCEKASTMGSVARLLMAKLAAVMADQPVKMNADPTAIACANGVVNLTDSTLRHARPDDYITRNTGVVFKHDADYTWWEQVVLEICGGNPRLAEFLQVWAGYSATGYTREHCMAILWGRGRNGKNLLIDSIAAALGDYSKAVPAGFLETNLGKDTMDNNMLYAMAKMDGIRMAYVSETGEKGKLKESWVKGQTGDRKISARLAHKDYYEFLLTHKLMVGTNHKPEITGTDDGVWERIRMIPMRVRFGTQDEVDAGIAQRLGDKTLLDKASSDQGREAVLRWIVEGARKYLANGLKRYTPAEITAETTIYRREQDVMGQFLQDATEWIAPGEIDKMQDLERNARVFGQLSIDDRLRIEKQELWRTYKVWCEEHGHFALSATAFARRVTQAQRFWQDEVGAERLMGPLEEVKSGVARFYRYIRLSDNGRRMRNIARSKQVKPDATAPDKDEL
jgi:putative DNA primase/helicase